MLRYYIYAADDDNVHAEPGDTVVWEGRVVPTPSGDMMLCRHLYDIGGLYFMVDRRVIIEFVPETDLEDDEGPILYTYFDDPSLN